MRRTLTEGASQARRRLSEQKGGKGQARFLHSVALRALPLRQHRGKAVIQRSATGFAREKRLPFAEIRGNEIHSHERAQKSTKRDFAGAFGFVVFRAFLWQFLVARHRLRV